MTLASSAAHLSKRAVALVCLLLCPALGAVGCDDDDGGGAKAVTPNACDSKSYCYEVEGGLDAADQQICVALGSQVLAACDPTKATRKCTQATKVQSGNGPEKEVNYIYYFREGDTTACAGTEEKLN